MIVIFKAFRVAEILTIIRENNRHRGGDFQRVARQYENAPFTRILARECR